MADMVVAVPAHLERIEREGRFLRRNSTGSLGIPIAKSKVLSRYLSDPKGSCHDVCKGTERDLQTSKARTSLLSRTVAASEKIPELVATVQVQIRKKPLRSSKLPVNFKRCTAGKAQRQENPANTKRLAVSVEQQNGLKMKSLQENANSMSRSYKLRIRGYSSTIIPGGSSIAWDSPLDGATSTPNKGRRMDKNTGSSKLGNKKAVGKPANLEKIEHELSYLRRNSTGNLGIEMDDSKVLPRHVSVPTGSLLNASKDGAESNCKTKERTHVSTRSVISSGENSKLATTVKWQIRKKPLRANKLPANFRWLKTTHGEHMQARTKKLAVSACHQNDSKLKPLEENAYYESRSNKPSRRRYSDSLVTGGLPTLQGSILDDAITKTNTRSRMDKDIASYESSKKTDVGMPANLDKIESGIGYLRRNSTGSLGIEMGKSKVLSCSLSVPTCSCQEVCKCKVESDLKTKAGTLQPTRRVTASGEIPEMATTVKMHKGKKPSPTTFRAQAQKNPASTKIAVKRGSSGLSKKKDAISISNSTRTSVKRASGEKLTNNSMRMVSQRNKKISLPSKTGKVINEDYPNKGCLIDNLTRLARTKKVQSSHENFPNKAPQLRELASLKRGKAEPGSYGGVPKGALYIRESKTKSQTRKITSENQNPRVSSLDRHGPIRGKRSSPLLSPSSSQYSDGSSSRNIGNRKSSLSSTSASESVNGDAIVSSSKKSGTATPNQYIKAGRAAIGSPKNLKFRKGKIIDFQSEKLSPRRLKFRPAKILENNGNEISHVRGRSSRRLIAYGKSNSAKDETMKVNLRHQSRGDKKEAPILFNNVIEETATKLEETRRSKVKALVGAFETVISLQDPTSSPPILIWR
ncbi:putative WEB family protein-like [Capsicum annuum]|nr:putative WEB family protein-like [Capsicum annuum]